MVTGLQELIIVPTVAGLMGVGILYGLHVGSDRLGVYLDSRRMERWKREGYTEEAIEQHLDPYFWRNSLRFP